MQSTKGSPNSPFPGVCRPGRVAQVCTLGPQAHPSHLKLASVWAQPGISSRVTTHRNAEGDRLMLSPAWNSMLLLTCSCINPTNLSGTVSVTHLTLQTKKVRLRKVLRSPQGHALVVAEAGKAFLLSRPGGPGHSTLHNLAAPVVWDHSEDPLGTGAVPHRGPSTPSWGRGDPEQAPPGQQAPPTATGLFLT